MTQPKMLVFFIIIFAKETKGIPWNFAKFLLDKDGKVVKYYVPETAAIKIKPDIQELLK